MNVRDMFDVSGRAAVVTGGASGLGLAFAEVLAEHGARVTLLDRNAVQVGSESARMRALGWDVRSACLDVTNRAAVHAAFEETVAVYGRLDVVFANAGIDSGPGFASRNAAGKPALNPDHAIENYSDDRWDAVIETNLNSVFTTIKAAARHMKPQRSGRIIVTTSIAAFLNRPYVGAAYMAAKAGAAHLARNAAMELGHYNITVNSIAPGLFVTNIADGRLRDPGFQSAFAKSLPLQRVGSVEEIKGLALYLASPASSFMTGAQLVIDGGGQLGAPY